MERLHVILYIQSVTDRVKIFPGSSLIISSLLLFYSTLQCGYTLNKLKYCHFGRKSFDLIT